MTEVEEFINKINKQCGYIDHVDAFKLVSIYTDIYGVHYYDNLTLEDELIVMWNKIREYKNIPVKKSRQKILVDYDGTKTCKKCKLDLPKLRFDYTTNMKDGLYSTCKECVKQKRKNIVKIFVQEKHCSKCKEVKDRSEFYTYEYSKTGLHSACKKCMNIRSVENQQKKKK